ncbi:hypothetical protein ABH924_004601 [Arthrobacter sp. GAS37]|uniref:hypothetical protein n=1 Tax=Arthrobacter sp. GAS37 TaxID=3156261 RepID=UPI0038361303
MTSRDYSQLSGIGYDRLTKSFEAMPSSDWRMFPKLSVFSGASLKYRPSTHTSRRTRRVQTSTDQTD